MADQDFFSTHVPATNPKPGHSSEPTESFAKAIQSRFNSSSLTLPPPLHLPSTSGSRKKPSKHGFPLSMPAPALSPLPTTLSSVPSSTIPTHSSSSSSSQFLCSSHPPSDLDQFINDPECLILDIRSHAAFTTARLANALSLSVPSTLLKRPLYSLDKLAQMLSSKSGRIRFSSWAQASSILIYDADSSHISEGSNLYGLLKKFRHEGYPSEKHLAWLKGGFVSVWKERKDLIVSGPDKAQVEEDDEDDTLEPLSPQSTGLLRASALPSSAFNLCSTTSHRPSLAPQHSPTQPITLLPATRLHPSTTKSTPHSPPPQPQVVAFNPFYDTVRQNLELSQGVSERIPLTLPASVRVRITDLPFQWLRHIARRAAPATRNYTPLDRSAENTEEDTASSSTFSSSSSACDSDPDTTPPLSSPGAPRPPGDLVEEGTEALAMQFYRIELGEQRRLMGIMQHHTSESGRVLTSSSSGSPSSEENYGASVPRVRHHKPRLNHTEVSFPYSITAGVEKGAKNR
jgi:tyrosine-protein phosphatase 2/3